MKNGGALSQPWREVSGLNGWHPPQNTRYLRSAVFGCGQECLCVATGKVLPMLWYVSVHSKNMKNVCVCYQVGTYTTEVEQKEHLGKSETLSGKFHLFYYRIGPCSITYLFCMSDNTFNFDLNSLLSQKNGFCHKVLQNDNKYHSLLLWQTCTERSALGGLNSY